MTKIIRRSNGFSAQCLTPVGIYSCKSVRDPDLEPVVRQALMTQAFLKLRSLRLEPHEQAETCIVHGKTVCLSSAALTDSEPATV